jgi:glycosyltransferase involved in cell wall biosynthesis
MLKPMHPQEAPFREKAETANPLPLVSVVVPTFNRRALIEACVRSLAAQTYSPLEVIVSDDGSTDETPEFMERFLDENRGGPVRYLRTGEHRGANPARNCAVREARGELIAFTDSDCVADGRWIEELVRPFADERVAAVVGMVNCPPPTNIFELVLKGLHRVPGPAVNRLVGGNMCVRREHVLRYMFHEDWANRVRAGGGQGDTRASGGCDEEGLYLALKAEGYRQAAAPEARVLHVHPYSAGSFFKQALLGGRSAAMLVYKYHLPVRLDLLPFMLMYLSLPLAVFGVRWLAVPAFFFVGANAALSYNELFRKGKTIGEWLLCHPLLLAYYQVRLFGYAAEWVRLHFGRHTVARVRLDRRTSAATASPTDR